MLSYLYNVSLVDGAICIGVGTERVILPLQCFPRRWCDLYRCWNLTCYLTSTMFPSSMVRSVSVLELNVLSYLYNVSLVDGAICICVELNVLSYLYNVSLVVDGSVYIGVGT